MYAKINNQLFQGVTWNVHEGIGELGFKTEESLSNLEEVLDPTVAMTIEIYDEDDDEMKERWYNRDLCELIYKKLENGNWHVVAKFQVSAIDSNSENEIRQSIDDSDEGIMELAAIISDFEEMFDGFDENFKAQQRTLNRLSDLYNTLADRVANLENK